MKKININEALKIAYHNLYTCKVSKIDKNLETLIKVKRLITKQHKK